jgi:hypothetical protein
MRFQVTVQPTQQGDYLAECDEIHAQGTGLSATAALDHLRQEIRYRLEYCPCSGIEEDSIELDVTSL